MASNQTRIVGALLVAGFLGSFYWFRYTFSADLMSVWLAGKFLAMGMPEHVYAPIGDQFFMYAPIEWREFMQAEYEYDRAVFPFLYPPLWAGIFSLLSEQNFWVVAYVASAINAALQMATIALALKAVQLQRISPVLFTVLAMVFLLGTHIGTQTLRQNQLQIFVNFLLVLTVERSRARDDISAALALALAASIKLYPAAFALFWLFSGNRRAFWAFVAFGAALGLASILWAGWPLHAEFLHNLQVMANSILITPITFSLDVTLSQLFYAEDVGRITAMEPPNEINPNPGYWGMIKPWPLRIVSALAVIATIIFLVRTYRGADHDVRHATVWPLALTLMPLLLPLNWVYYFVPAAAFAGVLLDRLGTTRGAILWLGSIVLIFGPFLSIYRNEWLFENGSALVYPWAGFISFSILSYGYWQASRASRQA